MFVCLYDHLYYFSATEARFAEVVAADARPTATGTRRSPYTHDTPSGFGGGAPQYGC